MEKEIDDTTVKDIRNLFRLKEGNETIKDKIIRDIRNLFEHEKEDYYKSIRVGKFWSNNYIKYESKSDRNKRLSIEEHLSKIRPYLKNIINNLKKSDTWKIQLTIAISFIFSKDNDEDRAMQLKSDNIEIMINDKADEVTEERFEPLLNRYQIRWERPMRGCDFIFDCIYLLYYKCHKINPNRAGSYIDSPDWIKNKKATINPISKKENECFQYAATVALNCKEIRKNIERISKIKPFTDKCN